MDISDEHSDNSDGSGSGHETKRTKDVVVERERGPKWACSKATFGDWYWESEPVWDAMKLTKTYLGENRDQKDSPDPKVRARYAKGNRKLFRCIIKQLERDNIQAKSMRLMIKDEFGADRDGYALLEYLTLWANDLTTAEVKKLKRDITNLTPRE